ncbi:MAG: tetratricopeptide repeat protein [Candidatus Omnitrophica bacterium]|nr:tetratricopeptide repeat protein [Candidatus Omnitrophota bacterium]MBU1128394.1 tetratricopeptide repeat protein [Candidatus Omnitrophota bacterium]MBU1657205.1 tetratricopeptide repeat protein [Candidatus Omnitrophota bacterium]MBU1784156.1 tetratricopeptide repeat protein [Candidatus Omnitrophota bacterium]MBU1851082.1 tetratricopeptide repeat protein [Candidatus Omnitrophota bacterium]
MSAPSKLKAAIFVVMVFTLMSVRQACAASGAYSEEAETLFRAGNEYYEQGDYARAREEYRKILEAGYESANIYYNLGNAYFKAGDAARAVVSYERSKRLNPGDADLASNYKFVRANIETPLLSPRGIWNWRILKQYHEKFTVDVLFLMSSGVYAAAIVFLLAGVYSRRLTRRFVIIAVLLLVFAFSNLFIAFHAAGEIGTKAVVMMPETESYYGPFDSATVFFKLAKGIEVTVLKRNDDWCKIRRADGERGWVKAANLEII